MEQAKFLIRIGISTANMRCGGFTLPVKESEQARDQKREALGHSVTAVVLVINSEGGAACKGCASGRVLKGDFLLRAEQERCFCTGRWNRNRRSFAGIYR